MQALHDHIYVVISTNEDVHALTYACKENIIFLFIKCTRCMHAHLQTHNIPIDTAQKPQWLGSWYRGCAYGLDKWYMSLFLLTSHDISMRELRARTLGTEIGHQKIVLMFRHVEPGRPLVCRLLKCASRNTLLM